MVLRGQFGVSTFMIDVTNGGLKPVLPLVFTAADLSTPERGDEHPAAEIWECSGSTKWGSHREQVGPGVGHGAGRSRRNPETGSSLTDQ